MPKNTPKFSLYCLPFVGSLTFLLCDLFYIAYLKFDSNSDNSVFSLILETFNSLSSSMIFSGFLVFLVFIPLLYFFRVNIITQKNIITIIAAIILYKVYQYGVFRGISSAIYQNEKYIFLQYYLFIVSRLNFIIMLIIPFSIFLHFFKSSLDCYKEPLPQGQKKWLLANLLSIAGIFNLILWVIYTFSYLFRSLDILYTNYILSLIFTFLPTCIALAFMMLSKQIILTDIKTRTVLIIGVILAAFSLCLLIISANLIEGSGYGVYIILPFLLVSVPIATIIFTIVIVNKMYSHYKID